MDIKTYRIIKERKSSVPDPLTLTRGEIVVVGQEYSANPDWPDWIECKRQDGNKGWVPKQCLAISGDTGTVLCDYSAHELNVNVGDEIIVYKAINGRAWSKNSRDEQGWVPVKNIRITTSCTTIGRGRKRGWPMEHTQIEEMDKELIEAAINVIRKNYRYKKHTVGAAVRCSSGKIYVGVNIDSCGYGPCAEPIALGAAISSGEKEFLSIVAVGGWDDSYPVLSPCGNCRQLLFDYASEAMIILAYRGELVKTKMSSLLPDAYRKR